MLKEGLGDGEESFPGPDGEPVNGTAVDEGWEHATSGSEGVNHWTHTDDDMQILLDTADEVVEYAISEARKQTQIRHHIKTQL